MLARKALAGTAGAPKLYVEDVMSCFLYTGNSSTQTITNNIDLSTEGGLVWAKCRTAAANHRLTDTVRGAENSLISNSTLANQTATGNGAVSSFTTTGYTTDLSGFNSTDTHVSWTFRKAKKFFDVVTYTGDGSSNRQISHNLGSVPGCVIVKRTDSTGNWPVYHRMLNGGTNPEQYAIYLNLTNDGTGGGRWANTAPTSTQFSVNNDDSVNANSGTYVAYLFAHDAGGFGDAGSDNVISCGSVTTGSSGYTSVNLGYEPQWVMVKTSAVAGSWIIVDNMRGLPVTGNSPSLSANNANAEDTARNDSLRPTATGFDINADFYGSSREFIYIAIRRGPMKTPTTGTSVYSGVARTGTGAAATVTGAGFAPDLVLIKQRSGVQTPRLIDRLRGNGISLFTSETQAESNEGTVSLDTMDGCSLTSSFRVNENGSTFINWFMRRAPGFFDVVCWSGTAGPTTKTHNLGVTPELMIVKKRNGSDSWWVYSAALGNTKYMYLNTTAAADTASTAWNDTSPTSTQFTVGGAFDSGQYVAYLFASLSGVSKVGSYTGNGSSVTVTTDFQPRFILVKRTDSTGNWIVGDSARGLVSADEPALFLNTTAAETTGQDWVDVSSTGFTVNETALNANVNTATYIYLAVA